MPLVSKSIGKLSSLNGVLNENTVRFFGTTGRSMPSPATKRPDQAPAAMTQKSQPRRWPPASSTPVSFASFSSNDSTAAVT